MNMLQLLVKIGIQGVQAVVNGLKEVENQAERTAENLNKSGQAAGRASEGFTHFRMPLLEAVDSINQFQTGIKEVFDMLGAVSGLSVANKFADIQQNLEMLTGSAFKAKQMMQQLKDLGADTPFDTEGLASYAATLLNMGTDVNKVLPELKTLANLAAYAKVPRAQMGNMMQEVQEIRGQEHPRLQQVMELVATHHLPLDKLLNAATGSHYKGSHEAMEGTKAMTGEEFYKDILKGSDAIAKNAALMASLSSPSAALANILENLNNIMEPTGEALQKVLLPLMGYFQSFTQVLKNLNDMTGGSAGASILLGLFVRTFGFFLISAKAALRYTQDLTRAIADYAVAAEAGAMATPGGGAGALGGAATKEAAAIGASAGEKAAVGAAEKVGFMALLGSLRKIETWVKPLGIVAKALKSPMLWSIPLEIGGAMLGAKVGGNWGKAIKDGASMAGWGAILGGTFGKGNPYAILGGAILGAVGGGIYGYHSNPKADKEAKAAAAMEKAADAMKALSGKLVGGGTRGRTSVGQIEMQMALTRAIMPLG